VSKKGKRMSSMLTKRVVHLACFAVPLALAFSCKVDSKDDYTFTDNPPGESGGSAGKGGSGGRGGSGGSSTTAGKAGSLGTGDAGAGSNEPGTGGTSGTGGSGSGGESGSGGTAGNGGEGGEFVFPSGGQPGEGGAGGEVPVDPRPCEPDPCIHGVCVPGEGENYSCDCDAGYSGVLCEINTNECDPNPCQNNGVCTDGVDDYECDCTGTGYLGSHCEVPVITCLDDPCSCAPCAHGTCENGTAGSGVFTCNCGDTGYEGTYCENDIDDCAVNPCQNDGRCVDTGQNSYECDCRGTHYYGATCTKPLCGNGTLDPGEETDSTADGTREVPVNPITCRFDFSDIKQWFCAETCGFWGDRKEGCQQEDADAFCRLKMDDFRATARSFDVKNTTANPGICCPTAARVCAPVGNFGNRGVDVNVLSTDDLASSHGTKASITNLVCTGERGL
jgi:hypothetical protein